MNESSKTSAVIAKSILLLFVLVIVAIFLLKPSLPSSVSRAAQGERVFENAIPENAPIRIKIKKEKEKSFRELKNEKWVREFELEVKNVGDKPIYFIFIDLGSDVKIDNIPLVFSLVYGRAELGDIVTKAQPDDIPLKPGETYVFKIHPGQVPAWEMALRGKSHPDASRIKATIQMLSYGDGTGYFLDKPYTPKPRTQSTGSAKGTENKGGRDPSKPSGWASSPEATSDINMPVTLLPAYLFEGELTETRFFQSEEAPNISCGLFDYCVGIVPYSAVVCYNCPAQNRPGFDSGGECAELENTSIQVFRRL